MHVCLRVLVICVCLGGVSGLCTCECMCSQRPEECVGSPDAGVIVIYWQECWESSLDPLHEWYVLLTPEHLSSPISFKIFYNFLLQWTHSGLEISGGRVQPLLSSHLSQAGLVLVHITWLFSFKWAMFWHYTEKFSFYHVLFIVWPILFCMLICILFYYYFSQQIYFLIWKEM